MAKKNNPFKGLDETFDTSYDEKETKKQVAKIEDSIKEIDTKKKDLKKNLVVMNDVPYIKEELMTLISSSKNILEKLEDDIKVGSPARMYEVYATLLNSITNELKELRQLNYDAAQLEIEQNKKKSLSELNPNDKVLLSSDALLDMISTASRQSEMNRIDADFEIQDSYDESIKKKER